MAPRVGRLSNINPSQSDKQSKLKNANSIFNNSGGMLQPGILLKQEDPLALRQIRARQEDYWNKIAVYNYRVHLMEE